MKAKKLVYAAFAALIVLSCSKDDDPKPTPPTPEPENQAPTVSFVSPTADTGTLWNTITVELNAADSDGAVAKVELFVNDAKEAEVATAPFTFNWNSKGVEDGVVELKAVVTDNEGETATSMVNVNVKNLLLDYYLYDGYLKSDTNVANFTYITSPAPEREILYVAQITSDTFDEAVQRPDDFGGETFDVHFLEYIKDDVNQGEITTYHGVTPGDFHPVPSTPTDFGSELGEANVTFTEVLDHDYALIFSGGNTNPITDNTQRSFTVYEEFDLGYVYLRVGDVGYYHAINFGAGDHVLPLSAMDSPMEGYTFTDDGSANTVSLLVQGHTAPGRFSPAVTVYRENAAVGGDTFEANFHVPKDEDEVFDHYYTNVRIQENGKHYVHEDYDGVLTSMKKLNATFLADNKTLSELDITATSTDNFDFLKATFQVAVSGSFMFNWESYSSDDNITFPPIPTEVFETTNGVFNSTDIAFKDVEAITLLLEDRDNYSGYDEYIDVKFGRKTEEIERKTRLFVFEQL
ncbi:Ig-like domain-containing protein [Flagellimonas onchidii]|uniref:Ig-like domain-containing protein n=1 Tax=Flagellimonas onchidii TaxID=2562684 RepID=UPI0010A62352|nr:Ig-like domain-containing protein [Allomuricauda onchidii]